MREILQTDEEVGFFFFFAALLEGSNSPQENGTNAIYTPTRKYTYHTKS